MVGLEVKCQEVWEGGGSVSWEEDFGVILWSGLLGIWRRKEVCVVNGGCGCLG